VYLKYSKIREDVKDPVRAHPSDAGLDVFYYDDSIRPRDERTVYPSCSRLFKTGLKFEVPHGYMLRAENRSSMAAKKQLIVGACVIDSGYNGEVFIDLHNIGDKPQVINIHDKIAQLVLIKIETPHCELVEESELYKNPVTISDRGDGALGSTDG